MKKRLVSLILATLLIFTSIPAISVHASAATTEDGFVYSISDGEVTITAYTGSAAELTVPAEIEGCPVTSIGDYAFSNRTSLTSIDLPDSVTNIGKLAFIFCSSLTSITLPDSVTSIGDWAFVGCDSLANINIPQCVTCINVGTFSTCRSLTSVTIPVGVLSISDCAFDECTGIRTVYYEGSREQWNAIRFGSSNNYLRYNNIEYLGEPKPEPVPLPEGFAYEIVDGEATVLYYVGTPTELTVPAEFEGYPVTRIGNSAFACHEDLISIDLPDTVTSIGDSAFMRCFSLENINIPDGVTSICEGAFSNCSSFTSITLPDGVTLIDERAFYGCDNLTSINVPDSVLSIGEDAFTGCYSLESINLLSVTSIGRYAFLGCYDLTSITISASLKTIEDYAFNECENLKTVYYVGYEKEWNAIGIGSNNESLTSAEIIFLGGAKEPEAISEGLEYTISDGEVTITDYKGSATEIDIPATIEGYPVTTIGRDAFFDCESITSITIPEGVKTIEKNGFYYCISLTSIVIPESVTTIGDCAFKSCQSLESIIIPEGVTSLGRQALSYCTRLESITLPDSLKSIGEYAFSYCSRLTSISIPDGVYAIGSFAFSYCDKLASITMPESLSTIGMNIFDNCISLATIYFTGTIYDWSSIYIREKNEMLDYVDIIFLGRLPDFVPGDVDGNGVVNGKDSHQLIFIILGLNLLEKDSVEYIASDLNGDISITSKDANILKMLNSGEIEM